MKLFTVDEANGMIPEMRDKLERLQSLYARIGSMREAAEAAAAASTLGGGMAGGSGYVRALYKVGKITTDIHEAGVQLKDYDRGLIDFPSMRDGRIVLLCWQLGEGDKVEWWHETDAGFAGRQLL